jgi:hypothetical protein
MMKIHDMTFVFSDGDWILFSEIARAGAVWPTGWQLFVWPPQGCVLAFIRDENREPLVNRADTATRCGQIHLSSPAVSH